MNDAADPRGQTDTPFEKPESPDPQRTAPPEEPVQVTSSASEDIDREVAEAMASMDAADRAALSGEVEAEVSAEPGAELTGTVVGVSEDDVFLEFGVKSQGVMPRSQFGKKETIAHGRRVDVILERYDQESDLLIVNRAGSVQRATWTNLQQGMRVEGRVVGVIKGGLEIDLRGIRAFMPGSHVDIAPMKDVSLLLNQKVECEVLEVNRRAKNVLLSRRKLLEKQRAEAKEKLLSELEIGQIRNGTVGTIMDYGAFVDLGGVDGLVHIRDLSWGNVDKVTDVLSVGQEIEVKVLKVDRERERISLGIKQAQPDPWTGVSDRYPVGTSLKVRVIRLADFGAFAELEKGVEGLIPISEMSWSRIRSAGDVVSTGDMVDAVVIRVEPEEHRIALSMKQAQADPWEGVLESFEQNSLVKGKVTRLAGFGAFVEVAPGVEGLVHISELSDQRVRACDDVVQVGQEVETRVLGIDKENRRISLSIKAVNAPPTPAPDAYEHGPVRKPKKRKKPLRGGLTSHYDW